MNVEPTSTGSFQTTPLIITAGTNNPNGYTLYFSVADNSTALSGNNGSISALDNNGTTGYTSSTFTMNRWGYSIGTIASPDSDTTIYHPAPTITNPTAIDTYVGAINSRATTINLATKVDFATAAGSYSKQLVVSMLPTISTYELIYNQNTTDTVANLPSPIIIEQQWSDAPTPFIIDTASIPTRAGYDFKGYTTTNGGTTAEYAYNATTGAFTPSTLTPTTTSSTLYAVWEEACTGQMLGGTCVAYMQDFADNATAIKNAMVLEQQYQLKDARDNKTYWVAKLKDGNVWMTQNLDYDIKATDNEVANRTDSNTTTWSPDTVTSNTVFNSSSNTGTLSYDGGNYYWNGQWDGGWGSGSSYGNFSKFSTTKPADQGDHYHVGNLYQWNAATAGTGSTIASQEAASSICPKGWRLPLSNSSDNYSFSKLLSTYDATSDTSKIISSPLFFVPAGYVYSGTYSGTLWNAGNGGHYWSSMAYSGTSNAYILDFLSSYVNPSNYDARYGVSSVRCVAR